MGSNSKDSANLFALSALPQADYVTAVTPASSPANFRQIEKTDRQFANYNTNLSDNKGYSTGTPYATRKNLETHDVNFPMTEEMSSQLLGERARAGFGDLETEELTEDASWTHNFSLMNPQDRAQLPAYTYAEKAGESASRPNAHNVKYPSVVCGQWAVQGQGRALVKLNTTWTGSGKRTAPSGVTFFGGSNHVIELEEMTQNYFRNTAAALKLYPQVELGGTVYNVNCDFRDFDFSINWNLQGDAGYLGCGLYQTAGDSESGAIRGKCEVGDPTVQFNFTMLDNDGYDGQGKLQSMASISAQLDYTGSVIAGSTDKHKASFILNAANIVSIEHVIIDMQNGWRVTTEPLAIGQVMPVSLVVVNNVESYTAISW